MYGNQYYVPEAVTIDDDVDAQETSCCADRSR